MKTVLNYLEEKMKLKAYSKKSTWLRILDKLKRVFKSKSGWLIIPS